MICSHLKSNYTNEQSISTIMRLYDLQNKPKSTPTPTLAPIPEPTEVPTTEETDIPETDGGETTVQEINKKYPQQRILF